MVFFSIGFILGLLYFLVRIIELFLNRTIINNRFFLFLGILGVAILASNIDPSVEWDLYRHYEEIEKMRIWGAEYAFLRGRYSSYYVINFLFYVVSLTPWNGLLVFISIFIELWILEDILHFYKKRGLSAQTISICFFLFFSLSNIVLAISGIRNVLASVLMGYAIWNIHYKHKHKALSLLLIIMSISIHPASGLILMVYLMSFIPSMLFSTIMSFFLLPLLVNLIDVFKNVDNPIISSSAELFGLYTAEQAGLDTRVLIVSSILIIFTCFIILYRIYYLYDKSKYIKFHYYIHWQH